ncbi:hypothetical protein [Embleya sp. NBC_00896]|uniref:hypothetical protein n=1 Tax=Embleya sp. NBC_00896 TaxID=2975961 RepID=UPI002F90E201|nr:hypothetical protein OG928_48210 [Embleya sp. NBC_00896]
MTVVENHLDPDTDFWDEDDDPYPIPTQGPTWALICPYGTESHHLTPDAAFDALCATVDIPDARMTLDEGLGAFVVEVPDPANAGAWRPTGFEVTLSVDTVWGRWHEGAECMLTTPTPISALTTEETQLLVGQLRREHACWWAAEREIDDPALGCTPACYGARTATRCESARPCSRRIVKAAYLVPADVLRTGVRVGVVRRSNFHRSPDPDARWLCLSCVGPRQEYDVSFTDREIAGAGYLVPHACQGCETPFPKPAEPVTVQSTTEPPS